MGDATDLDRWAIIDVGGFADDEAAAQWIADQYGDGLTAITRWAGPCDSWGRRYIEVTAIEPA